MTQTVDQRATTEVESGRPCAGTVDEATPSGDVVSFHVGPGPSRWGYTCGCRCEECRTANNDYARKARQRRVRPDRLQVSALLPPGRVRSHVSDLIGQGMTAAGIGREAGLSTRTVLNVVQGIHDRISPRVARALLDVLPPPREACHDDDEHRPGFQDPLAMLRLRVDPDELAWKMLGECRRLDLTAQEYGRVFFPGQGGDTLPGKEVCNGGRPLGDGILAAPCPVKGECLAFAVEHRLDGIWGGTHASDRDAL